ncbi:lactate dehydrogenase [Fructilactobacillus ixorae]|uniref:Lactate dehydrogenase n=1 Tax=Fructilactobacillus ixorae TaxID=1750535 RepID=A0ABY5C2S8_9LACO|nr:lactate dehydrogenase [Fructilactobacillus ixorae]USS92877.1 lactate dehydrogenase [Fructilactobacillus ixorae]
MQAPILIKGDPERVQQLTAALAILDLPVTFLQDAADVATIPMFDQACRHFSVRELAPDEDLRNVAALVYLPAVDFYQATDSAAEQVAEKVAPAIDQMRPLINDLMARAFQGKIVVDAPHDEVFLYFIAAFSGLDVSKLVGVGNVPVGLTLREQLVRNFKVANEDINVSVCGLNTRCVVPWNRIYIGAMPLLSYVARPDNNYDTELIGKVQQLVSNPELVVNPTLQIQALLKVLRCLLGWQSELYSVVSLTKKSDQLELNLMPKIINQGGLSHEFDLKLSETEVADITAAQTWAMDIIQQIKKGRHHETES